MFSASTGVLGAWVGHMHACRQADKVKVEVAEARSEIMAPLSAASMESYSRAYPYLVKLHMLQVCTYIYPCQFWLDELPRVCTMWSMLCADLFGVGCVMSAPTSIHFQFWLGIGCTLCADTFGVESVMAEWWLLEAT